MQFLLVSSLKSSVNCLNTKDTIFAPMDDDRPCSTFCSFIQSDWHLEMYLCSSTWFKFRILCTLALYIANC